MLHTTMNTMGFTATETPRSSAAITGCAPQRRGADQGVVLTRVRPRPEVRPYAGVFTA